MDNNLNNIQLKFKCPADYNAMADVAGGKFCTHCQKTVHDFTNTKADVFRQIMAENNYNVCGRFAPEQMAGTTPVVNPVWKRWLSAAMVLVGINMMQEKALAQGSAILQEKKKKQHTQVSKKIPAAKQTTLTDSDEFIGLVIEPQPEYPGGMDAFSKFLARNIKSVPSATGKRVFASFVVEKDGTLSEIKIMRGINDEADKEVLRVIKLSAKWNPAMQGGKPIKTRFIIPVMFTK